MPRYYGTVKITLNGYFEADGIEEILDEPMECGYNVSIETEIIDM